MAAFGAQCERILDKTARIPGQSYVCLFHQGDEHTVCNKCLLWEELCPSWADAGDVWVRCHRTRSHPHGHYTAIDGRPFTWSDDYSKADAAPAVITFHGGSKHQMIVEDFKTTGSGGTSFTFTMNFSVTF